jgi:gamma-glutamyltranspeptidase/glutathione hydrolase
MDWSLRSAPRPPVLGRNSVATSQPLAAQAGLRMLLLGGNAVDAAIAAAATLTVVEPTANGLGSDAFALVWHAGRLHGLNGSGRSPARLDPADFAGRPMPRRGWPSVTVPGAVSAWGALHERFGRLPWASVLEPALRYAADGFAVSPGIALSWARAAREYRTFRQWMQTFAADGRAPAAGQIVRLPDHARTLQTLAEDGWQSFYRGRIGRFIGQAAQAAGAALHEDDLAGHQAEWAEPLCVAAGDLKLWELPPNGQGVAALQAVGILAARDALGLDPDSPDGIHHQLEAMKLAFADAHRYVADPATMEGSAAALVDPDYLTSRAIQIDSARAGAPGHGLPPFESTVYLCAADAEGTMVSFIQSNYEGFGSGVVVPFTGIAMQNRAAGFVTDDAHPNRVGPGKRPFHTIIPAFVSRGDEPVTAFGVMGGPMQPQGHLQVFTRMAMQGQNPQAALDAPRWRVEEGQRVLLEPGLAPGTLSDLRIRGHRIEVAQQASVFFGGGQAITRIGDSYVAGSDCRRDGQAVAF